MATLKKLTPKAKKLIREHLAAKDVGRTKYREADTKLDELIGILEIGKPYPLGNGEIFTINDNFAANATNPKQFKPASFSKYSGELTHE